MLPLTVAWRHVRRLASFTDWRSTELGCMWKPRNLTSSAPDLLRINFAGFSPNLNGDHIISWVTSGSTVGLVLAGDPVKRHVLPPHYDVQELAGNLGSDNAPPISTCIKYFKYFIRKCQTTIFIRISQATVDGNSKSFKDSWFWGLADSIILNVEGRLNSEGVCVYDVGRMLRCNNPFVCCITATGLKMINIENLYADLGGGGIFLARCSKGTKNTPSHVAACERRVEQGRTTRAHRLVESFSETKSA